MPTYEYKCEICGYRFTRFQKMSDEPVSRCPRCSGPVRRLISGGGGIIFKGSGFYETDYKRAPESSAPCCGMSTPCDSPKRCCQR